MPAIPWEFQYSVEVDVPANFAWEFWTDLANWHALEPGVQFELDGPFAAGATGRTTMPGQPVREWTIRAVDPGRSWIQAFSLPDAAFVIGMQFEPLARSGTSVTQRLWLEGRGAEAFVDAVRAFESSTPAGLKRIGAALEQAYDGAPRVSPACDG